MNRIGMVLVAGLVIVAPLAAQAPKEAPKDAAKPSEKTAAEFYKDAKVGDWVQHKITMTGGPAPQVIVTKDTITAKSADEMTIRIEQTVGNQTFPANDIKVNLKEKHDPSGLPPTPPGVTVTLEKVGSGKETVTLAGKKYECEWVHNKVTMDGPQGKVVTTSKVWTAKDAPINGLVKSESTTEMPGQPKMTQVMELVGSGRGK